MGLDHGEVLELYLDHGEVMEMELGEHSPNLCKATAKVSLGWQQPIPDQPCSLSSRDMMIQHAC